MRSSKLALSIAALIATGVLCEQRIDAQAGQQIMIMNDDNGGGPVITHFSSVPDFGDLREPDFKRSDLPIFNEKLLLSEPQTAAIERQIQIYLEMFEQLRKQMFSLPGMEPMAMPMVQRIHNGDGEPKVVNGQAVAGPEGGEEATFVITPPNMEELPALNLDELEEMNGEVKFTVGLQLEVGEDGEFANDFGDGGPGGGDVELSLDFEGADELPEDVRKELEKRVQELADAIRKQMEERQAQGDDAPAALPGLHDIEQIKERQEAIKQAAESFRRAKTQLRQEFVAEAQTTLSASQVDRWPSLERALLRERALPKGRLSGERTDLFKAVKNMELADEYRNVVTQPLESYDLDLDAALRHRNAVVDESHEKLDAAMSNREYDKAIAAIDRASAARIAVRTINERYAEAVAAALPEEIASKFRQSVLKSAYPQVYRTTIADRTFDAALKLEGLAEATQKDLQQLHAAYRMERDEADTRIRRALDKHQPDDPKRPIEQMRAIAEGADPQEVNMAGANDPMREAFNRRRELDDRYIKAIKACLTPEQIDQLPKAPSRNAGEPIIIRRSVPATE